MIKSVAHKAVLRLGLDSHTITTARSRLRVRFLSSSRVEDSSQLQLSSETQKRSLKKVKTKKKFDSLPKRLVLGNGEVADPLPAWDGGLGLEAHTPIVLSILNPFLNYLFGKHDHSGTNISADHPKRKRRKSLIFKDDRECVLDLETEVKMPKRSKKTRSPAQCVENGEVVDIVELADSSTGSVDHKLVRRLPRNQLAKEILENLAKFPHCILLTRVGQFYESYFDQAQEVSRLLSIKLTKRTWDDQRVWMCGFPLMHLDKHLKTLVQQHNRSVAMCEEFRRPRELSDDVNSKPVFERRVVRVLTPGTLIDESFLDPYESNYLLAVSTAMNVLHSVESIALHQHVGLAWIDVSTGEFSTQSTTFQALKDYVTRISPREIVVDNVLKSIPAHPLRSALQEVNCPISYSTVSDRDLEINSPDVLEVVDDVVDASSANLTPDIFSATETSAIALLNSFLHANLLEHAPQSLRPAREDKYRRMQIDAHSLKALEIRESSREGGTSGSLMSAIKRTVTSSGTRLLSRWLCSPSTSFDEITSRQALVELFRTRSSLRADLVEYLKGVEDASRISQRFLLGKGDVDDLISIKHTIGIWEAVKSKMSLEKVFEASESGRQFVDGDWKCLDRLMARLADLGDLAERIELAVESKEAQKKPFALDQSEDDEEQESELLSTLETPSKIVTLPNADIRWTIKPQYSTKLASLHNKLNQLQSDKENLQARFQQGYDAPSLALRHNPSHGMHVHISKPRRDAGRLEKSRQFMKLAESKSTKMFFNQEWFALGNLILETVMAIYSAEKQAFITLRNEVNAEASAIRRNARIFDELDVTSAFANLASEMNFVRPVITEGPTFHIKDGRHPTVELGLLQTGRMFTSNSVSMLNSSRLHVITGPNMAGKSTYLRQAALIAILAQTGSFVPADSAEIGIVDKVFSRIGAKDDLYRDRSTFMVEMLETADILNSATERSLVIMDEVGRGTTVKDGLAIAFATVHHLYFVNRCRALFATHFHEIVDMLGFSETSQASELFPDLEFSCTDVNETEGGRFTYSHRMRPGVNRDSHGLKVAQLAGLPPTAIRVAEEALSSIKVHQGRGDLPSLSLQEIGQRLAETHIANP